MSDRAGGSEAERFLVEQVRAGDENAWRQLIERYQGRLTAYARRRLGGAADVDDVVQETMVGFVQSLGTYDSARSLETYLFAILRNQINRVWRKKGATKEAGFDPLDEMDSDLLVAGAESPSGWLAGAELTDKQESALAEALRQMVRGLRDRERLEDLQVVELSFYAGGRNKDIAGKLGRDEKHVAGIKFRAIEKVREMVGEALDRDSSLAELASELTVSSVWRRHRVSCLKRSTLGAYQLGVLEEPWLTYATFHLKTVRCELCLANAADVESEDEGGYAAMQQRVFASSVGFLSRTGR
jgi:RNA polymerase sigma-70 factor (ECF subfamily)